MLVVSVGILGALPLQSWAQADPAPLRLTLKDAVVLALSQNLDLQVANLDTATRQADREIARSRLLPQASVQATEGIHRYNLQARIGLDFAGYPANIGPYQAINAGVQFSAPLFDLSLIRSYQASVHRLSVSKSDVQATREQTVLLVVGQYFARLKSEAEVKAAGSRVELAIDLEKQAEALEAGGIATKIDVSRAAVTLIRQKQSLIDAQREVDTSLLGLKTLLNLPDGQAVELVDPDVFSQTLGMDVPDAVAVALSERPEIKALEQSALADALVSKAATARSFPTLSVNGDWNQQGRTLTTLNPGYDYEAVFNVPIFLGGRLRADRKLAALDVQRDTRRLTDTRNRVTEQVRDGEIELKAARSQVDLGHQQVSLAKEEVELAQGRFSAGVTDNIEVTTAQDELARANDIEIGALYRYNIARVQFARAVGSIELLYTRP